MATLIRMNAWTPKQWELIISKLNLPRQQKAGVWNIDWSDDKSDCESWIFEKKVSKVTGITMNRKPSYAATARSVPLT